MDDATSSKGPPLWKSLEHGSAIPVQDNLNSLPLLCAFRASEDKSLPGHEGRGPLCTRAGTNRLMAAKSSHFGS